MVLFNNFTNELTIILEIYNEQSEWTNTGIIYISPKKQSLIHIYMCLQLPVTPKLTMYSCIPFYTYHISHRKHMLYILNPIHNEKPH